MKALLKENAELKADLNNHINARGKLFRWAETTYSPEDAYTIHSHLINFYNENEKGERYYDTASKMVDQVKYEDMVQEWVDEVYKILGKE